MRVAAQRKLASSLLTIGVISLAFSFFYYHGDERLGDLYNQQYGDKLERTLKKAVGDDATPCPRTHVGKNDMLPSTICAEGANRQDKPFYATYEIEQDDGLAYRGLARTAAGEYVEYTWNPGTKANALFGAPSPQPVACTDVRHARHNWQGVLTCTDLR